MLIWTIRRLIPVGMLTFIGPNGQMYRFGGGARLPKPALQKAMP